MTTNERLRTFIVDELGWSGPRAELTDDLPLIDRGVLDSMGIFELVAFLESDLGVPVGDGDLVPENFESIRALAAFVDGAGGG